MIRLSCITATGLFFFAFGIGAETVLGDESRGGAGKEASKANLDLPFEAGSGAGDEESDAERIIFYGQEYEGSGIFFCCGDTSLCDT